MKLYFYDSILASFYKKLSFYVTMPKIKLKEKRRSIGIMDGSWTRVHCCRRKQPQTFSLSFCSSSVLVFVPLFHLSRVFDLVWIFIQNYDPTYHHCAQLDVRKNSDANLSSIFVLSIRDWFLSQKQNKFFFRFRRSSFLQICQEDPTVSIFLWPQVRIPTELKIQL